MRVLIDECASTLASGSACDATNPRHVCPLGHACEDGACTPGPGFGAVCSPGDSCAYSFTNQRPLYCRPGTCTGAAASRCGFYADHLEACDSDAAAPACWPCAPGLLCAEGRCLKLCLTDQDCPCGTDGVPRFECIEGSVANVCGTCRTLGQSCRGPAEVCCDSGQSCRDGRCCRQLGQGCGSTPECCGTDICLAGSCQECREPGASCASSAECCSGASCQAGICRIPCTPGAPCPADAPGECRNGTTECTPSQQLCIPGAPVPETCNGKDDDCNGTVDDLEPVPCVATSVAGCQAGFEVAGTERCVGGEQRCVPVECDPDDPSATDCYCTSCGAAIGGHGLPCGACSATPCTPGLTACIPDYVCAGAAGDEDCTRDFICVEGRTCWTPADVQLPPDHCYY